LPRYFFSASRLLSSKESRIEFEGRDFIPSEAKARIQFAAFAARLKLRLFKTQACEEVLKTVDSLRLLAIKIMVARHVEILERIFSYPDGFFFKPSRAKPGRFGRE
jgi:hypothetical protein